MKKKNTTTKTEKRDTRPKPWASRVIIVIVTTLKARSLCPSMNNVLVLLVLFNTDVNECEEDVCDSNARCFNTEGSHVCRCRRGFTGDGKTCTGINIFYNEHS